MTTTEGAWRGHATERDAGRMFWSMVAAIVVVGIASCAALAFRVGAYADASASRCAAASMRLYDPGLFAKFQCRASNGAIRAVPASK